MKSYGASFSKSPTGELVHALGVASANVLLIGASLLPLAFHVYVSLQAQALRLADLG